MLFSELRPLPCNGHGLVLGRLYEVIDGECVPACLPSVAGCGGHSVTCAVLGNFFLRVRSLPWAVLSLKVHLCSRQGANRFMNELFQILQLEARGFPCSILVIQLCVSIHDIPAHDKSIVFAAVHHGWWNIGQNLDKKSLVRNPFSLWWSVMAANKSFKTYLLLLFLLSPWLQPISRGS